jgi:hypothetical protein
VEGAPVGLRRSFLDAEGAVDWLTPPHTPTTERLQAFGRGGIGDDHGVAGARTRVAEQRSGDALQWAEPAARSNAGGWGRGSKSCGARSWWQSGRRRMRWPRRARWSACAGFLWTPTARSAGSTPCPYPLHRTLTYVLSSFEGAPGHAHRLVGASVRRETNRTHVSGHVNKPQRTSQPPKVLKEPRSIGPRGQLISVFRSETRRYELPRAPRLVERDDDAVASASQGTRAIDDFPARTASGSRLALMRSTAALSLARR